ncbi:hypothetical protein PJ311_19000 [Bacillus sp. CLL-7-23]|uniref:PEP-CTERM protein-sorting domain-containing protein n=1 Tax=Bacillus changyiensis TaxID=3004103 RepID=A0ABT4X8K4_9BACI|nr:MULTISPECIES: hypothetical protein [Bacillus]MDA7028623.1 hypothetical protein [Bacillus changyiensis]NPC91208.1 hypothetical protein [Bacillus sp. WMMC1349]
MKVLASFILGALGAILMFNVKKNTSPTVTTIVLIVLGIVVFTLDELWKRYKRKQEQD